MSEIDKEEASPQERRSIVIGIGGVVTEHDIPDTPRGAPQPGFTTRSSADPRVTRHFELLACAHGVNVYRETKVSVS